MKKEIKISKNISDKVKQLKNEECAFIYGNNIFTNYYKCKLSIKTDSFFKVNIFSLLLLFFLLIFKQWNKICFCHGHGNNKHRYLSFTDYQNIVDQFYYLITYKKQLFIYKKNETFLSLDEYLIKEV